jgi:cation diffusion facilitator CzcD-associated flavoprotein CzcO
MSQTGPVATDNGHEHLETSVAIIGAGFAGLGMAIQLRRRGREDFLILEKSHDVGGVWRDNTYPGCGCDVPTVAYSFSFEQNPFWSKVWSSQPEIHAYLRRVADKYDIRRKTLFGAEVVAASWDASASRWHLRSADGRTITAQFLVMSVGPMTVPKSPELKGIESFTGAAFHSSRWDHSVDLTGKRVAVIGTGASAIQFVPAIAEQVKELQLYQRTPPWVLNRFDPRVPKAIQALFAKVPLIRNMFRAAAYWVAESQALALHGYGMLHKPLEWAAKANIRKSIKDPTLAARLTPDYQIGCKRILYSPTYYPALARPNAEVITDGIAEVRPGSVVTADGTERAVDVIIYGTGFNVVGSIDSLDIRLDGGESLVRRWKRLGMQAHMGVTVVGMPNAFFLMGPNSAIAHNSIVFMIEQQIKLVLRAMDVVQQRAAASIEIRRDAQDTYNEQIHRRLDKRVWSTAGCNPYFLDDRGVNRALWPGFSWEYWRAVRNFDETQYEFTRAVQGYSGSGDAHASGHSSRVVAPA